MTNARLTALLAQTERLLELALCEEWEELTTLLEEHEHLVGVYLAGEQVHSESELQILQRISLYLNQTLALAEQNKTDLGEQLRVYMHGKQAQKAYAQPWE